MTTQKNTILIVEDSITMARTYGEYLKSEPYDVQTVNNGQDALDYIQENLPRAIVLDLQLPDIHGLEVLKHIETNKLPISVIVNTAEDSIDTVVEAMRLGAFDYIVKPFNSNRFKTTLRNAIEHQRLSQIVDVYQEDFSRNKFCDLIGSSLPMLRTYRIIECAAPSKTSIFISGETGTGKELCAEALHRLSPRADSTFVTLNCAAIPKDLMESEIFGHVRGAFTGASSDRVGAAKRAHGGTLFLDELCELNFDLQSKLLRFIQSGTYQRVGSSNLEKVDVRFICATNRNIHLEVSEGRFREDLYYRLHVIPIELPPLRDRGDDTLLIARHFLAQFAEEENKKFKTFSPEVESIFLSYDWPGNVRELQNVLRNIVVLNNDTIVTPDMLPTPLCNVNLQEVMLNSTLSNGIDIELLKNTHQELKPLWQIERDAIETTINLCQGNITQAAHLLDVSPSSIYRKRKLWKDEGKI